MLVSKEILVKGVDIPLIGRIGHFLVNWQKLSLKQDILSVVKGYKIPFIKITFQQKVPSFMRMNKKKIALMEGELKEVLTKGKAKRTQTIYGEFLRNLFLWGGKDGGFCLVINLKMLNQIVLFLHFLNGRPFSVKALNTRGRLNAQTGAEICILQCSIGLKLEEVWKGSVTVYEFMCLCFGLGPIPRMFTKLLNIPISLLRKSTWEW